MDAKDNRRKEERHALESSARLAFYVPLEYADCYGTHCFNSEIIDSSDGGFGIIAEAKIEPNAVVNIMPTHAGQFEGQFYNRKVYQSKIKWIKKTASETYRMGVQHIP